MVKLDIAALWSCIMLFAIARLYNHSFSFSILEVTKLIYLLATAKSDSLPELA